MRWMPKLPFSNNLFVSDLKNILKSNRRSVLKISTGKICHKLVKILHNQFLSYPAYLNTRHADDAEL